MDRLQQLYRRGRNEIIWCALGFVACQLALGYGVEYLWPAARDPEFAVKEAMLRQCLAQSGGRPLILALGSSRTRMGLEAEYLSGLHGASGPVVFNFGLFGAGALMNRIVLERLLTSGIRPDAILLEVMPLHLSDRDGGPIEENALNATRLTLSEVQLLRSYTHQPLRMNGAWAAGRVLPAQRHQAELRELLQADVPMPDQPGNEYARGLLDHGWQPQMVDLTADEGRTQNSIRAESVSRCRGEFPARSAWSQSTP